MIIRLFIYLSIYISEMTFEPRESIYLFPCTYVAVQGFIASAQPSFFDELNDIDRYLVAQRGSISTLL